jgi:hypothetical protein
LRTAPNKGGELIGAVSQEVTIQGGSKWVDVNWGVNPIVPPNTDFYLTWESSDQNTAFWNAAGVSSAYEDTAYCVYSGNSARPNSDLCFEILEVSNLTPGAFAASLEAATRSVTLSELGTATNSPCAEQTILSRSWLVTDECGNTNMCTQNVSIVELKAPTIAVDPQDAVGLLGGTATFEAEVPSCPPLSYQWFFGTEPIPHATNSSLVLTGVNFEREGIYTLVVTNVYGAITSSPARLYVAVAPRILEAPGSLTVTNTDLARFSVNAEGTPPLTYEWYFNSSTLLVEETNSVLELANVDESLAGLYQVVVRNAYGSALSSAARLTVAVPAAIVGSPVDQVVTNGSSAEFGVAARGSQPLNYQWFKDNSIIPGANGPSLTIENTRAQDEGMYHAVVSNPYRSISSGAARLTVLTAPWFVRPPADLIATNGDDVIVSAQAAGTGPLEYAWAFEGELLPGADEAEFLIQNVSPEDEGTYTLAVTGPYGSTNASMQLTVVSPPSIFRGPVDQITTNGANVQFSVKALGSEPLEYQWYFDTTNVLAGETNTVLDLQDVGPAQAGTYTVEVKNPYGSESSSATLLVLGSPDLLCAPDRTYLPSVSWEFEPPEASSNITVILLSTVTNQTCGKGFTAVRTWLGTNVAGGEALCAQQVTVLDDTPAKITTQPVPTAAAIGGTAVFSVVADSCSPVSYTWFFNRTNVIADANGSVLMLNEITSNQAGLYSVGVSNEFGGVRSTAVKLDVGAAPVISVDPADTEVPIGEDVTFSVEAAGQQPLSYQWFFGETEIPGASEADLSLSNVGFDDEGEYY